MAYSNALVFLLAPLLFMSPHLVKALVVNGSTAEANGTVDAHIYFLLDRSGSMHSIASDVVGGFNSFVQEQRSKADGAQLRMTLVQFDSQDPHEVLFKGLEISEVPELTSRTFIPRSQTPLFDALGNVLALAEGRKSNAFPGHREAEEKIVVVTFTDGQENASREFTRKSIFARIEKLRREGWAFVFLGANQDSYGEGGKMGFGAANTQNFAFDKAGVSAAFKSMDNAVYSMRTKLAGSYMSEDAYDSDNFFDGDKAAETDYRSRSRAKDL